MRATASVKSKEEKKTNPRGDPEAVFMSTKEWRPLGHSLPGHVDDAVLSCRGRVSSTGNPPDPAREEPTIVYQWTDRRHVRPPRREDSNRGPCWLAFHVAIMHRG